MRNIRTIEIRPEHTHGARIVCSCGYEDKAFSHSADAVAERHNNVSHRGAYEIRVVK